MTPPDRTLWQPLLLAELRRGAKYRVAVDLSGTTVKTVRRHIIRDNDQLGAGHPSSLGEMIRAAIHWHRSESRRKMEQRRRAAADAELARQRERRAEHNRRAAVARWHGGGR